MTTPAAADYASFAEGFVAGQGQVLWRERVADLETPVGAFLKLAAGRPNSFLLESVEGGSARGRYSAIGLDPDLVWRCRGGRAEVNRHALAAPHAFEPEDGNALDSLRRAVDAVRLPPPAGLPPMATGLFGYLAYDMVRLMERLPADKPDALGIPDAVLARPGVVAVFDHVRDALTLCAVAWPDRAPSHLPRFPAGSCSAAPPRA